MRSLAPGGSFSRGPHGEVGSKRVKATPD